MVSAMRGGLGAFFILIKAPSNESPPDASKCKVSPQERAWLLMAKDSGYATMVSSDFLEIENAMDWYMRGDGLPPDTRAF